MTDWIALGEALVAYRQPPEPPQATFKRLLDHHARGTLECRAKLTARGRQPREVSVPPQALGRDAPFWFRLLDAIKADTFRVIWPRERDALLWQVEFRGEGLAPSVETIAETVVLIPPPAHPPVVDIGSRKRVETLDQRTLRIWLETPAVAAGANQFTQEQLHRKFAQHMRVKRPTATAVKLSWFKKWYKRHSEGQWWDTLRRPE